MTTKGERKMLVSFTFEIEDKVKDKLERIAKDEHRTLAAQLRLITEEWLEKGK